MLFLIYNQQLPIKQTLKNFLFINHQNPSQNEQPKTSFKRQFQAWSVSTHQASPSTKVGLHSKLDPHNKNGILCHFALGGKAVVSPQTTLTEKKIDMISRQRGCNKAISLNSPFTQQSDQCCRQERFGDKNLPCLWKNY